ncbi:MAG: penicillin-binding protein 2 [Bacteroidales bacterium]|nr:penicillin-binding protein 2 [Candidatus Sodaliphilus limicaballi]
MRKNYNLEKRKYVIGGFITVLVIIYIFQLYVLQLGNEQYKENADNNAFIEKITYPSRGLIYDRKGRLIVYNEPAYDLVMIPRDVHNLDTLEFCNTLRITREDFEKRMEDMRKNPNYSAYIQQTFMSQLTPEDYGRIQEKLYRFPGFFIAQRILRQYNYHAAANVLGCLREVKEEEIKKDNYYRAGDYTGDMGIEKSYEKYLRGVKGKEVLIRDALGKIQGHYNNGANDVEPVAGNDLNLTIDIELQQFGEELMRGKIGAIVCIEPKTGEILALVTSPSYDPALLAGRDRGKNYTALWTDNFKPLFDRSIQGAYPPGSTFKLSQGLIFEQEQVINLSTAYPCHRGFISGGLRVGCHGHGSPITLKPAIQTSCNGYFCWGLKHMLDNRKKYGSTSKAFEVWKNYMVDFGYGYKLNIDIPGENRGFIPNSAYYDKNLGEGKWVANSIISDAIGQGEILATPLQIANMSACIANRGYYITPHVVRKIAGVGVLKKNIERHETRINKEYFEHAVEGMRMSITGGTSRSGNVPGLDICGKTGTAQNPHGRDHSAFMGFAPMNDPKIAVAVYVENGGFGATFGVPIGTLMIEKYLSGKLTRESLASSMSNTSIFSTKAYGAGRPGAKQKEKAKPAEEKTTETPNPSNDGTKE